MLTARFDTGPLPHELTPQTDTFPEAVPNVTVMLLVLAPAVITAPGGRVQLYPVALDMGTME
jgi:hypothetical protein